MTPETPITRLDTSPQARSHHGPFGSDTFGRKAESFARFFGTPRFLIGQTIVVAVWITVNVVAIRNQWDPYPFILLNLAFSLQAAYAAPLILLAQTRQADRDRIMADEDTSHREELTNRMIERQESTESALETIADLVRSNLDQTRRLLAAIEGRNPAPGDDFPTI